MADREPEVLYDETRIQGAVVELARRISRDYAYTEELVLIGVLRGSFVFLADLARRLTIPRAIDFVAVESYGHATRSSGDVKMLLDVRVPIAGRDLLIVEDIVDTGRTLAHLREVLAARRPASLRSCALLSKPSRREIEVPIEYLAFEVGDVWVVGYGLDCGDRLRGLPYIGMVEPGDHGSDS